MFLIISLILSALFCILLTHAIISTTIGLCKVAIGLTLMTLSYILLATVWCIRSFNRLRSVA